jgi:hypothetical protein
MPLFKRRFKALMLSLDGICDQRLTRVSIDRAGIDGNWSTFEFSIGDPPQLVHVLASTALSELWAVGEGGCIPGTL